ncbi:hypothetical protein CFN16_06450 [Pseudomonas fluorescens]|uniref:DUF3300 domain-containing protein n=1 Tax=Pseudomonas fluorescens TaxID=294 RepID=A0A345UTI4_PSEFL|nr:DUF3300 domain-containing protein [Pseudomonas fluorescens]AXJ03786.1 hypothetical protein CFN16_06450 [Pseudomonas fluorescens]WJK11340.1 DUF3300 domain-containing protein [Pseudomonas fluorescens]
MHSSLLRAASLMLALSAAPLLLQAADAPAAPAAATAPAKDAVFTTEQLDQMLASIALYPDPLLAQVLMAATYPGEVAEAAAWSKAHPDAKGDDAVKQVASQTWDPSVQALVAFPQVLATLGQDPVWVQRLGDAFLAQPDELMAGVQRLRRQAQAAGNLQSNQYQNVTVQNVTPPISAGTTKPADNTTIIIQPADPQVVYVPTYNPTTTYGTWPYPASPPVYYPPPPAYYPGQALVAGLAFGTGVAVVASLWGNCDWGHNDIDIDVNRYNNINVNNRITNNQNKWQHNTVHRDGVPYRDNRSRAQFGRQLDGAAQRDAYRGDNAQRAQARERARSSMDRAGIERPATSNREARNQVREAQSAHAGNRMQGGADRPRVADRAQGNTREARQPGLNQRETRASQARPAAGSARNNAFAGARSPSQTRLQADRGRASQISAQRPNVSRAAGHQISRPSGGGMRQRGGGRR